MKIVSITMVKNEVEIIESFIRYHLNIVDEMIILDNYSSDETPIIINKLISEGLPISLIKDKDNQYTQYVKMNFLLKKAFEDNNADLVCVLDADEFIISQDDTNPREILENIDNSYYYLVKWITYVPTENDFYNKFIPKRITHMRNPSLEEFFKVIIPKNIFYKYDVELSMGNHDLIFKDNKPAPPFQKPI